MNAAQVPDGRPARTEAVLIAIACVLIVASWVGSSPFVSAPDEPAHYVKAIGVASRQLAGVGPPSTPILTRRRWMRSQVRAFDISRRLLPVASDGCHAHAPSESAACTLPRGRPAGAPTRFVLAAAGAAAMLTAAAVAVARPRPEAL